ncbi:hypothetical protein [Nocardia sp. NBC_01388]|uniref:hypothetical protein n=1 Tax=Nocardia sp. NBC_01388 TaxID=2903596 RepID=UPI0032442661
MRKTMSNFGRKALIAALPLAVAATFASAGTASATAPDLAPQSAAVVQMAVTPEAPIAIQPAAAIAQPAAPAIAQPAAPDVAQSVAAEAEAVSAPGPQNIATNPDAANHDPLANGAALGGIIGGVTGAVVCAVTIIGIPLIPLCAVGPALQLALVGMLVGALAPQVIPQVLP